MSKLRWYGFCGTERVEERDTEEEEGCDSGKAGDHPSRLIQASSAEQIAKGVQHKAHTIWNRAGLADAGEEQRFEV